MANKKEPMSVSLSKLILTVSVIVSIGALFGAVGYLVSCPQQAITPIINTIVKKEINVIVSTDKMEYEQGETIKITLESNTSFDYFKIYWPYYTVLKKENGEWKDIARESCLCPDTKCQTYIPSPKDFSKSLIMNEEWDQKIVDCNNEEGRLGEQAESGVYMISVEIPAYTNNGFNLFYSNEFTIKEKTVQNQDVSIATDKTEYERGEILKLSVKNNLNENVCFESCNTYYFQKKNGIWREYLLKMCEVNFIKECIGFLEVKEFEIELFEVDFERGVYRIAVSIYTGCQSKEWPCEGDKTIYSNEFTIK